MKEKFRQDKLGAKNPMWGKPRPERVLSCKTIERLRELQTGKKLSEETKRKVAIASKAYWDKRKASEALQTIGGQ